MVNHTGQRDPFIQFLAAGENPKGFVSQVPNNTVVGGAWFNNDPCEVPPGADYMQNENIPTVVQVTAHTRKAPAQRGPTAQKKLKGF